MNINVVKIRFKFQNNIDEYTYKYYPFQYCCEQLKDYPAIEFDTELDDSLNENWEDVVPRFSIMREEPVVWEDYTDTIYTKINYCPFCGQKININIVGEEDWTARYASLEAEKDAKKAKMNKTDSKTESARLEKEIGEINYKLNGMYYFNEYSTDSKV